MAEIKPDGLETYLNSLSRDAVPPVFLVFGEEYLVRQAFARILDFLVPPKRRGLEYEAVEGDQASLPAVIQRISTYSMMQEKLVVAVKDAPLFPLPNTREFPGYSAGEVGELEKVIGRGVPENHFLIMTTFRADKRKALFRRIQSAGLVVDCSVPSGSRMADKKQQSAVLRTTMEQVLARHQKGIDGQGFNLLVERTGFDPAAFADNLEKLVAYIGKRQRITSRDVDFLVTRSKQDAIFELTNAVAEKNSQKALFYLKSLSDAGFHHLQMTAALINQMRKLLVVKDFVEKEKRNPSPCWSRGMDFNRFKQQTMPGIVKADTALKENVYRFTLESGAGKENGGSKKKADTDLFIASNPNNAYPVYHLFLKSDNFSLQQLINALMDLSTIDVKLKSSAGNPMVLLDHFIMEICG
ncbi:MAG: hypothetical protein R6V54_12105 [Desulfobacteraceae bacterium]